MELSEWQPPKRTNWEGPGGDTFLRDAWTLYDKQGDLDGLGPRTDPDSGNIYRVRKGDKNTFNPKNRTGLRIQPVNPVEGVSKGISASGTERVNRIKKATITKKEVIRDAKALFKENNINKLSGQTATQYATTKYNQYLSDLKDSLKTNRLGGNTAAHIVPTTDSSFIESADNYYSESLGKNAADQARVPTSKQRRLTGTNLKRIEFIKQRILGFGQDKPSLSNEQVKTILDKSTIKVPRTRSLTRAMLSKGKWIGENSINSRSNIRFNTGIRRTSGFDYINEGLHKITPQADNVTLGSILAEPVVKRIPTPGGLWILP